MINFPLGTFVVGCFVALFYGVGSLLEGADARPSDRIASGVFAVVSLILVCFFLWLVGEAVRQLVAW